MMDYEVFKKVITTRIKDFLPAVYAEFDVSIENVPKINGMKEAMIVALESEDFRMSGPNIYLDEIYELFRESGDIDEILNDVADAILEYTGTQKMGQEKPFTLDTYRDNIVQMLINTDMNTELLKSTPHKQFLDLSVTYRLAVPDADGNGYTTALITDDLMEELGVTLDELDAIAEENSRKTLETKVFLLGPELAMMTTEMQMFGAINLLRTDEMKKLADKMDADLYLLPSSVHDLMVIRNSSVVSEDSLFAMVREGNDKCNSSNETLSYNIYYYDREKNELQLKRWDK